MGDEAKQWVAVTVLVFRAGQMLSMRRAASQEAGPGLWEGVSGRVRVGEPAALFATGATRARTHQYAIKPDGSAFYVIESGFDPTEDVFSTIVGWQHAVDR